MRPFPTKIIQEAPSFPEDGTLRHAEPSPNDGERPLDEAADGGALPITELLGTREDASADSTEATPADLRDVTLRAIWPLGLFIVISYSISGTAHYIILPDDIRLVLAGIAGASVVTAITISVLVRLRIATADHADIMMQVYAVVLMGNSTMHMLLSGETHQAVNIGLVVACIGLFHLSIRHFIFTYAAVLGIWFSVLQPTLPTNLAVHYDFYLLNASFVAVIAFLVRRRAYSALIASEKRAVAREQRIKVAMERARIADVIADHERAKREFIANMSHELRTPLNAIIGFSEILQQEMFGPIGSDQNKGYVDEIHGAGQTLLTHLNDILELSSISLVDDIDDSRTFDLGNIVTRSVEMARARQKRPLIKVRVNEPSLPIILYAEEQLLKNALLHLISNAIKFNHAEGRVDILFGVSDGEEPFISIADTGRGISEEELRHALSPFWQHESALSRHFDGIGLGLTITHEMVKRLNGRMDFKSEPGCGTTATLYLPPDSLAGRLASRGEEAARTDANGMPLQADNSRAIA